MDKAAALVVNGFINLTGAQRRDFIEEVNRWINGNLEQKSIVAARTSESILQVDVGPTSTTCGCCGR